MAAKIFEHFCAVEQLAAIGFGLTDRDEATKLVPRKLVVLIVPELTDHLNIILSSIAISLQRFP